MNGIHHLFRGDPHGIVNHHRFVARQAHPRRFHTVQLFQSQFRNPDSPPSRHAQHRQGGLLHIQILTEILTEILTVRNRGKDQNDGSNGSSIYDLPTRCIHKDTRKKST